MARDAATEHDDEAQHQARLDIIAAALPNIRKKVAGAVLKNAWASGQPNRSDLIAEVVGEVLDDCLEHWDRRRSAVSVVDFAWFAAKNNLTSRYRKATGKRAQLLADAQAWFGDIPESAWRYEESGFADAERRADAQVDLSGVLGVLTPLQRQQVQVLYRLNVPEGSLPGVLGRSEEAVAKTWQRIGQRWAEAGLVSADPTRRELQTFKQRLAEGRLRPARPSRRRHLKAV